MKEADRDAVGGERLADELVVFAGHDAEQRALPCAVEAQHTDFRTREKREPDVFEHLGVGRMHLPETLHRVNELGHVMDGPIVCEADAIEQRGEAPVVLGDYSATDPV